MILLLGGSGYVGSAFQTRMNDLGILYHPVSRRDNNYTDRDALIRLIDKNQPEFLINAAGYTGKPNVDAAEVHKTECLLGNAVLPGLIREVCEAARLPWGHVSSGCIFSGRRADGNGFTEDDTPNFTFRTNNCSWYSGTKALAEECLKGATNTYLWRLKIPFNHIDSSRNYLSKLMRYDRLLQAENSISHLGDFVDACLQCWLRKVPFGTYNVTNPGSVTTRQVAALIQTYLRRDHHFQFFSDENEFMQIAAKTPRSNCIMDTNKLQRTGIILPPVEKAIIQSLQSWVPEISPKRLH